MDISLDIPGRHCFEFTNGGPLRRSYKGDYRGYGIFLEFEGGYWDISVRSPGDEWFILMYFIKDITKTLPYVYLIIDAQEDV